MSIKIKLVLLVCLMSAVPAAIVGAIAYTLSRSALGEKIQGEFDARLELTKMKLNSSMQDLAKNADAWSSAPVMADVKISDSDMRIGMFLLNTKKSYPIVKDLTVFGMDKKFVASTNPTYDDSLAKAALSNTKIKLPQDIFLWKAVAEGKAASMIGAKPEENYLVMPIRDVVTKDGTIVGILLCEINLDKLKETIAHVNDGKSEVDKINIYFSSGTSEIFSQTEASIALPFADFAAAGIASPVSFSKRQLGGRDFVLKSDEIGTPLPGLSGNRLLTVLQAESAAYASVVKLAEYVALSSAALVGAFVLFGYLFASTISRPILNLRALAQEIIKSSDLSKRIAVTSSDEIGALSTSFNQLLAMVEASQAKLAEYSKGLEVKVAERTKAIRTILDHVSFGLFICDTKGNINEGFSKSTALIINSDESKLQGKSVTTALGLTPRNGEHFSSLYNQIFDTDFLLGDLSVDYLPTRFAIGEATVGLTGSVIHDDSGKSTGVLFCAADITSLAKAEEEIDRNRGIIKMLSNRDSFRQFVSDVKTSFEQVYRCMEEKTADAAVVRRELHTLKGNFGVFGMAEIASMVHHIEDETSINKNAVQAVETKFIEFLDANKDLLGVTYGIANDDSFVVPARLVSSTEQRAGSAGSDIELKSLIDDFFRQIRLKRARTMLGPIEDGFTQLSSRLGKSATLKLVGGDTLLPIEAMGVLKNLSHLLRNALDHGIEAPEKRGNKPEVGTVTLTLAEQNNQIEIRLEDDGAGINPETLGKKAVEKKIISDKQLAKMSEQEIYGLIFAQGFSTAAAVTEVSGRGVGMTAVKVAVEEVGGKLHIASKVGKGTTFTISIPKKTVGKQSSEKISLGKVA